MNCIIFITNNTWCSTEFTRKYLQFYTQKSIGSNSFHPVNNLLKMLQAKNYTFSPLFFFMMKLCISTL